MLQIRLLKAEAEKYYKKLFTHGERCVDYVDCKINDLLSDLQDLSMYVNRILMTIHFAMRQLSGLSSMVYHNMYLPILIKHIVDLFVILMSLDELISSQNSIAERWKKYRVQVKSLIHNPTHFSISEEKIYTYEKLLKDLFDQLLSKTLFLRALENIADVNKNTTMFEHIMTYFKNVLYEVESKINDPAIANKNWVRINVGIVVLIKLNGTCDKKFLKKIIDCNKKLYGVTLVGNVTWLPNDFLIEFLPKEGIIPIPTQVGEKLLQSRTQKLPLVASTLIQRCVTWCIDMHNLIRYTGSQVTTEIEKKKTLLLDVIVLMQQLRENVAFVTNFHAFFSKPMSRNTVYLICRLIEIQKSLETTFYTFGSTVVQSQGQVLQHLSYQMLSILERIRKSLMQNDKGYSKERLDALSLINTSIGLINGPSSADRRVVIRCALASCYQLTESFKEDDVTKLRNYLDIYDKIVDLQELMQIYCDYSILLYHQSILPAYFSMITEGDTNISHIVHLFNAFNSAISRQELSELTEVKVF